MGFDISLCQKHISTYYVVMLGCWTNDVLNKEYFHPASLLGHSFCSTVQINKYMLRLYTCALNAAFYIPIQKKTIDANFRDRDCCWEFGKHIKNAGIKHQALHSKHIGTILSRTVKHESIIHWENKWCVCCTTIWCQPQKNCKIQKWTF